MNNKNYLNVYLLIITIGILFFIPFLGEVSLFDWDEVNFAEASREMIATGDYLTVRIDYQPFHEKPPLFFWLQTISMKIFGINEFAARFPNAIIGILSLLFIFSIGKKIFNYKFGILWVMAYIGSFLPHFYFRTGIIDPTFNLLIFATIYFIACLFINLDSSPNSTNKLKYLYFAAVSVSLAILTKGPVAYLLITICWFIFWYINRKEKSIKIKYFILFSILAFIPAFLWYIAIFVTKGGSIIEEFILYHIRLLTTPDASHGGPLYYHFVIVFLGCFPASIFAIRGFSKNNNDNKVQRNFKQINIILLCVVLGVFSIVETKIVHYSSLTYFPVTFLAAYTIYNILYKEYKYKASSNWLYVIVGIIYSLVFIIIPLFFINIKSIYKNYPELEFFQDIFTRDILLSNINWYGYEIIPGILYLVMIFISLFFMIKKKYLQGFTCLFFSTTIVIFLFLTMIVPKIGEYIQASAVEFYKTRQNCDCYVHLIDIPSYKYGHYFYTQKPSYLSAYYNSSIPKNNYDEWILKGDIDKPAFILTRISKENIYLQYPDIQKLYDKNGVCFLYRKRHNNIINN